MCEAEIAYYTNFEYHPLPKHRWGPLFGAAVFLYIPQHKTFSKLISTFYIAI